MLESFIARDTVAISNNIRCRPAERAFAQRLEIGLIPPESVIGGRRERSDHTCRDDSTLWPMNRMRGASFGHLHTLPFVPFRNLDPVPPTASIPLSRAGQASIMSSAHRAQIYGDK